MRILISGAAGFIGSHLADLLVGQGDEVIGLDNFFTGRRENVAQLHDKPRFKLIEHDVTTPLAIDGPVDRIYHLASASSPVAYLKHRIAVLRVGAEGTCQLAELATRKEARLLVASAFDVYGDPAQSPQREDYFGNVNPIGLHSCYEEAKRITESCTMAYHRERGTDTRIVRIFNTYGPRLQLDDGRVVTTFVRQALSDEPITVFGDGTQLRSICHVSDLVRGLVAAMEADFHEPINLGNPEEVTIIQLAREILELTAGSTSKIAFRMAPDYDPRIRTPDITRARQILGWAPKVPRREGLATLIEYYRQRLAAS